MFNMDSLIKTLKKLIGHKFEIISTEEIGNKMIFKVSVINNEPQKIKEVHFKRINYLVEVDKIIWS